MDRPYREVIAQAKKLLVVAILKHEPELEDAPLQLDARVRELTRELGREVLTDVFEDLANRVVQQAKEEGMTVERRPRIEVLTIFGVIPVRSPYLWNRRTHQSARPVKTRLGLEHRKRSRALERALTDFGAEESFAQADRRLEEHYGFGLGRTTVLRVVEGHARRAEAYVERRLEQATDEFAEPLAHRPGVDRMLTELDGCEIRTGKLEPADTDARTPVRKLPKRRRDEAWREVRVGLARPLDETEPTYVARMDKYPGVVSQLFGAACARGLSSRTDVTSVADGGNGLREQIDAQFPRSRFVLDRPHLKSHFYEAADAIGLKGDDRQSWVDRHMHRIDSGGARSVLDELGAHKGRGKARVLRLHAHLSRFRDAVHYDALRDQGLPIGSGEVESAHKSIPQKRMKLPGTWWHPENVNPMLSLRVVRANDWWNDFWQAVA